MDAKEDRSIGSALARGNLSAGAERHEADAGDTADAACEVKEEIEITPEMIEAGYSALTTPTREPWVNFEFLDWIEATTRGRHEAHPVISLMLEKVYRKMRQASAP